MKKIIYGLLILLPSLYSCKEKKEFESLIEGEWRMENINFYQDAQQLEKPCSAFYAGDKNIKDDSMMKSLCGCYNVESDVFYHNDTDKREYDKKEVKETVWDEEEQMNVIVTKEVEIEKENYKIKNKHIINGFPSDTYSKYEIIKMTESEMILKLETPNNINASTYHELYFVRLN